MNKFITKKTTTVYEEDNKYIIKKTSKDIYELFEYLKTRDFLNIPNIIEKNNNEIKYEYLKNDKINNINKEEKLGKLIASLHYKTSFFKDVSLNKYREIYDKLYEKIEYISSFHNNLIEKIENNIYPSPSEYYYERNFNIVNGSIEYAKGELKKWFDIVKDKKKERVVIVNNNLKLDHLILNNDKEYLVSWDSFVVDTPILDLYKLYLNENADIFINAYKEYKNNFNLSEEEKILLYIIISIPSKIESEHLEFENVKNIKVFIDDIYKINELLFSEKQE